MRDYKEFEEVALQELRQSKIVIMCIGTKKYCKDSFGVFVGDKLKIVKKYVFGSSVREINGLNYLNVYIFLKRKFPDYKILIIDSFFSLSKKKPILIFKKGATNVSGMNSNVRIGDYGILFNSFSYSNKEYFNMITNLLLKTFTRIA